MAKRFHHQPTPNPALLRLIRAIVRNDVPGVAAFIESDPDLVRKSLRNWSDTAKCPEFLFLDGVAHYLIAGDTPLHAAAAGHQRAIAERLIKGGADVAARNRRGATPLHYAADGGRAHGNRRRKRKPSRI